MDKLIKSFPIFLLFACSIQLYSQSFDDKRFLFPDNLVSQLNLRLNSSYEVMKIDSIITAPLISSGSKHTFQYNPDDKMTEWLSWDWTGTGWMESWKEDFLYDSSGILITEFSLGWSMTGWDTLSRFDYFYDEGKLARIVIQHFAENGWIYLSRSSFRYNTSGDIKSEMLEDFKNDNWQYRAMWTYFYSCSNKTILFQTWKNYNWQDSVNTDFFYNENGDLDSAVARYWDGTYWVNLLKLEIVNDNNHNQIQKIEKTWDNYDWRNTFKYDYTFDELHYIENAHCNVWNGNQWVEGDGDILLVNPDGFKAGFGTNNVAVYYENPVRVDAPPEIRKLNYALFPNYPNPFNPVTTIRYQIPISGFVELKIYDVLGREIAILVNEYKTIGNYEVRFDAGNLSSGVYFYSLRSGGFAATGKMIAQK